MISAGEASGELYGSLLSREVKRRWPDTEIFGIGGERMKSEGVDLIAPISHIVGFVEALGHLRKVKASFRKAAEALNSRKPDLLVLIDYPDFNITLAGKARALGIPILYYVSPQVWAWRSGRVRKIASLVNRMAVLFPFETEYYRDTGLPCEFVGHPIIETISINGSKEVLKRSLGLDPDRRLVSLLPGSRPGEIARHQNIVKEVSEKLQREFPDIQVVIPLTTDSNISTPLPDNARIIRGRTTEVLACSDAAAVTSGTATLETALVGTPMVVFYRVSPLSYLIAKLLVKVTFVSLVNILSGRQVVRELLQSEASSDRVYGELKRLMNDIPYRNDMISSLKKIQDMMKGREPSRRVAAIIGEMTGWSHDPSL